MVRRTDVSHPSLLRAVAVAVYFTTEAHAGITPYGAGCPDSGGTPPTLTMTGTPVPGCPIVVGFNGAAANSSILLFAGFGQGSIPVGYGCSLLVSPLFPAPIGPLPLDAAGDLLLPSTLPASLPAPFTITLQAFEIDPLTTSGFANSNGVKVDLESPYNATLYPGQQLQSGTGSYSVAIGDLNGDLKNDLVSANYNANNVSVFLGNGQGEFTTASNFPAGSNPRSVAIGDLNGDLKPDLVTANTLSSNCRRSRETAAARSFPRAAVEFAMIELARSGSFLRGADATGQSSSEVGTRPVYGAGSPATKVEIQTS